MEIGDGDIATIRDVFLQVCRSTRGTAVTSTCSASAIDGQTGE